MTVHLICEEWSGGELCNETVNWEPLEAWSTAEGAEKRRLVLQEQFKNRLVVAVFELDPNR